MCGSSHNGLLVVNFTVLILHEEGNSLYRFLGHGWSFLGHGWKGQERDYGLRDCETWDNGTRVPH